MVALSGELTQSERTHALQALRTGRARVCVATDVAARGIDLPDLGLVIHADLPHDRETLLHRSGRTGRAGRKGTCVLLVPYTRRRRAERLLEAANIRATWSPPPSADAIRARDRERLVGDAALLAEEPTEEDLAVGRALLAERSAEEIAAAFARLHRRRLPAPEEVFVGGDGAVRAPAASPRGPSRGAGPAGEDTVWFRMNVGRNSNADPRWLVPLICRRGHVTKREIGGIRILDRETRFEIARHAAGRFASAVRRRDDEDPEIRIEAGRTGDRPKRGGGRSPPDGERHRPGGHRTRRRAAGERRT